MPERRPAFQCYPSDDILANGEVAELSHEAFGLFYRLYCRAWMEEGLPNDFGRLARWARIDGEHFRSLWDEMAHLWSQDSEGRWRNACQEMKRSKAKAYSDSRAENGSKGGRPRKSVDNHMLSTEKHMVSGGKHMKSKGKANESSPSPIPSPSPKLPPPEEARTAPDPAENLVGWWIKRQEQHGSRPPDAEIAKQGRAAKDICRDRSRDDIRKAIRGMSNLFKYSNGQPWDLLDFKREFQKALEAADVKPAANGKAATSDVPVYVPPPSRF